MKVIDYSLIESDSHEEIVQEVAKVCREEGWFPSGGIHVTVWHEPDAKPPRTPAFHYAQALVKYGQ